MTLAETLRRGRLARSQVAVREPAAQAQAEPVARTQPEASVTGPEPGLRDWIGVQAMGIGLFMAIMDVQIVAKDSGHDIHQDQPELVTEAIRQVVTGVRNRDRWYGLRSCCAK